jgi:hypothetical protein
MEGERAAYALCRPPGHHAHAAQAAGFCFLNNAAIAAQALRARHARVAIIDVDVHHGNGTQDIFWRRADVLTVSLHADPAHYYPFFNGYAAERGAGPGEGFNVNLPLPLGSGPKKAQGKAKAGSDSGRAGLFGKLDTNHDGRLDKAEFSVKRDPADATAWFAARDTDKDGFISKEEFISNSVPNPPLTKAK